MMSDIALDAARMLDMLPESEQSFAFEFIKKLVRAWDPDRRRKAASWTRTKSIGMI